MLFILGFIMLCCTVGPWAAIGVALMVIHCSD
jgi:hypothetical protein